MRHCDRVSAILQVDICRVVLIRLNGPKYSPATELLDNRPPFKVKA